MTACAVATAVVLAAAGLIGCGPPPDAHAVERDAASVSTSPTKSLTPVRTMTLERRAASDHSVLPADILPRRQATVAAEIPGRVESVQVREGQTVRAGQVLATIDLRGLQQRLSEAQAVATQRRVQFERAEKLLARQSITQDQYLQAVTGRDVADAQLASARLELEKASIEAPWSGVVSRKHIEVGDYAQPGQPLFQLMDVQRLKVRAPAPSKDVPFLRLGASAQVTVEALPGQVFEGQITHMAAALDATARTLDVEVELDNQGGRLRPGMYAQLRLLRRQWDDALLLPLQALVDMGDGQAVYLFRAGDDDGTGHAERRRPQLGPILGSEVVVTFGLEAGDRLIVEGQHQITEGQEVRREVMPSAADGGGGN